MPIFKGLIAIPEGVRCQRAQIGAAQLRPTAGGQDRRALSMYF